MTGWIRGTKVKTERNSQTVSSSKNSRDSIDDRGKRRWSNAKRSSSVILGSLSTFQRSKDEVREEGRHLKYEPSDHWWRPPLSAWIQETNREIFVFFFFYHAIVVLLARFTPFCGARKGNSFCSEEWVLASDKALAGLAVGMFFLLAFRANQAYDRFWEGRRMWGLLHKASRDFARLVCFHISCQTQADHADRHRAIGFVIAFAVATKLHLRGERDIVRDLKQGKMKKYASLGLKDIANLQQARHMPLFCQDQLSYYLSKQTAAGKLSDHQLSDINTDCLSTMGDTMGACERIRNQPIPLSYVLQLRFFLILWLLFYPFHTVASYGWWTMLFANCLSFAVLGIEAMACEIENPFGHHRNDLDLDKFCLGIANDVHDIWVRSEHDDREELFERDPQDYLLMYDEGKDIETGDAGESTASFGSVFCEETIDAGPNARP